MLVLSGFMSYLNKMTVDRAVSLSGIGLHSGKSTTVTIKPVQGCEEHAPENAQENAQENTPKTHQENTKELNQGIVFRRVDLAGAPCVKACATNVISTRLGTCIANEAGHRVATVEHLMAGLAVMGISNAIIDIDGEEVPILDGSAAPFVEALKTAGQRKLDQVQELFVVKQPLEIRDSGRFIRIEPSDQFEIDIEIDFADRAIGRQSVYLAMGDQDSRERLVFARTFCQLDSVKAMREAGLCKGGSLENAIVVDDGRLLNGESLRDPQEFVLHKALDLVGDLHLLGSCIIGRVTAFKTGHDLNNRFCLALQEMIIAERGEVQQSPVIGAINAPIQHSPWRVKKTASPKKSYMPSKPAQPEKTIPNFERAS